MKHEVRFGKGVLEFELSANNYIGTLMPNEYVPGVDEQAILEDAFMNPIGSDLLGDIVNAGDTVAIVTSDISRPMPSYKVLPLVIRELKTAGIRECDIQVILALGSHRSHSEDEKKSLVGEAVYRSEVQILDSDMSRCVNLGICKNGTPVDVFEPVVKADRVICLGNIEYHYFAGYSGGSKAIMPGVSSHAAIQANHRNMVHKDARAANLKTNPVRQDIDEVPDFLKIDFIVNVVLNQQKVIIGAFAGHWKEAHRAGCRFLDGIYGVKIETKADVVVVSPGGFPKDLNLYQSQKGLDNSKHAVKPGGTIILCASAREGFGEHVFEKWMMTMTPEERVIEISRNFRLGGHKAAAIGQIQQKNQVIMVSDLSRETIETIGFEYAESIEEAIGFAIEKQGSDAKVLLMPAAGSTLPLLNAE